MNNLMESIRKSPVTRIVFNADNSNVSSILLVEPTDADIKEAKKNYHVVWVYGKNKSFIEKSQGISFNFTLYGNTITTSFKDFYKFFMNCKYKIQKQYRLIDVEINLSKLKKCLPDILKKD